MRALFVAMIGAVGILSAGCASPGLERAAEGGYRDCASCQLDNPGDVRVCERICHKSPADQAGSGAGGALH